MESKMSLDKLKAEALAGFCADMRSALSDATEELSVAEAALVEQYVLSIEASDRDGLSPAVARLMRATLRVTYDGGHSPLGHYEGVEAAWAEIVPWTHPGVGGSPWLVAEMPIGRGETPGFGGARQRYLLAGHRKDGLEKKIKAVAKLLG
ncbi:MAG: hypothetical protein EBR82_41995 [Caulobacteraceae bacterium]|nr:hypothetical protein [Caulobacteraceae bacterium]